MLIISESDPQVLSSNFKLERAQSEWFESLQFFLREDEILFKLLRIRCLVRGLLAEAETVLLPRIPSALNTRGSLDQQHGFLVVLECFKKVSERNRGACRTFFLELENSPSKEILGDQLSVYTPVEVLQDEPVNAKDICHIFLSLPARRFRHA